MDRAGFELIVISQYGDHFQSVPGGMGYVDEMIREAGLSPDTTPADENEAWLHACLKALNRRFGRRVRVRLVNPMSLAGLYLSLRFRFRGYPAVITPDGRALVSPSPEQLFEVLEDNI